MKSVIKLILLGVIVGLTCKFMNDNQITGAYVLEMLNEKVGNIIAKIEGTISIEEQNEETVETNHYNREFSENSFQANAISELNSEVLHTGPTADTVSCTVEKRVSSNCKFYKIDKHAINAPESFCTDIPTLVKYLTQPASNDLEKVRAIFTWIAHKISYDDYGFNTGKYADVSAQGVFKNRVSVCSGFAELFKAMVTEAGLEVVKILGYAKGYGYIQGQSLSSTNHAWNAVRIGSQWKLFDVTWAHGSGTTVNGRLQSVKKFDDFWFDTDPYAFVFTHLPENSQWQLINNPLSKIQFEQLPYVQSSFFVIGFQGELILNQILSGLLHSLPIVYDLSEHVQAISLPSSGNLMQNQPIRLVLKSTTAYAMAVINNGKWTYFEKEDDTFSLTILPQKGELKVCASFKGQGLSYSTMVVYSVK